MRRINARADVSAAVTAGVNALRAGKLVVVPTDTVYGVAADAFNPDATRAIFDAKMRDASMPLPVLVHSHKQLQGITQPLSDEANRLIAAYWPGPLTLIVRAQDELPWDLGETSGTVGVRMPFEPLLLDIIREVGPLAVTSANTSGDPAATTTAEAEAMLGGKIATYLDAGERNTTEPSTIVDVTGTTLKIVRAGPFDEDEVLAIASGEKPVTSATVIRPDLDEAAQERAVHRLLASVPGVGPSKVAAIAATWQSVQQLRDASIEELCTIKGIGPALAQKIHDAAQR